MRAWIAVVVIACTGSQQAKWGTRGESVCPNDRGCELAVGSGERYEKPDEAWTAPPDDVAVVAATKMPEVTCAEVGEAVAALELGNYAEVETRQPLATKYATRCKEERISHGERVCIYTARDKQTMAYCAPNMIRDVRVVMLDVAECSGVIAKLRANLDNLAAAKPGAWDRHLAILDDSCRHDRWTRAYGDCLRDATETTSCNYSAPPPLRTKLEDRFARLGPTR